MLFIVGAIVLVILIVLGILISSYKIPIILLKELEDEVFRGQGAFAKPSAVIEAEGLANTRKAEQEAIVAEKSVKIAQNKLEAEVIAKTNADAEAKVTLTGQNADINIKTENLKVVLFTSRNKDNKHLEHFKQRSKTFLTTKDKDDKTLIDEFENWSEQGLYGETSRFYISVNSRDSDKINKAFVHYLLNNPQISPASYPQRVASVAAKKENASEFKWLFDFDEKKELSFAEEVEQSLRKKFRKNIWCKFTKAINEYELVKPGDRIAVCISGGKDSMLMAKCFQELKLHNKFDFEVKFVVMDPGYSPENRKVIEDNAKSLHIPITIFETDIFDSVYHVENSPCYLCARMRRGHLYHFAQQLGCNKIALGHHYDDVIETILMGMLYGAQVQTMMPKLHSIHFEGMELIRPLYLVREDDIKAWRDYNGLHFIQCACKFTDTCTTCNNEENRSKRVEIKELIKNLKKVNPFVESNIFRSVENVNIDTVVGYKQHGIRHNFLEGYDDNPGYVPEAEKAAAETEQEKEGK